MVSAQNITDYIEKEFTRFGFTKRQEVSRLLFEIAKRDQCHYLDILKDCTEGDFQFADLKKYLLQRRYPVLSQKKSSLRFPLTKLDIDPANRANLSALKRFLNIYIEKKVAESPLAKRVTDSFPEAKVEIIDRYKEYFGKIQYSIQDYNQRKESLFIVKEEFDFFKRCPCSNDSVYCGLHVVNLGSGCPLECGYCYLQGYINSPGIILPGNIEDFFEQFKLYREKYRQDIRVGSGETTDSLVYDHITGFSAEIVNFFRKYPKSIFEFKTKTNNIDLLLTVNPLDNIIVSWTISPERVVNSVEHFTASLQERLEAASKCADKGYKIGMHFDPIIYYANWEEEYHELVDQVFKHIPKERLAWFSVGTLRMTPKLRHVIENRFPEISILNEEFQIGYDGKLRYDDQRRFEIYAKVKSWIRSYSKDIYIYLCMEEKVMCQSADIGPVKKYSS
ncbi:MAG: hypothetical protein H6755_05625 [Candidatus Omnitrophica bacterium]|nr:hypothetical protein [Candidatus Omnitrophota bacterium]